MKYLYKNTLNAILYEIRNALQAKSFTQRNLGLKVGFLDKGSVK